MKIKKGNVGEVPVDSVDLNGEVQSDGAVVEYIHNGNDSGEKSNSGEENQDGQKSSKKNILKKNFLFSTVSLFLEYQKRLLDTRKTKPSIS